MRPTVIRRTAIAASAVCVALLATACGGSETGGESKEKAEKTEAAGPAAKAKTSAELEKLVLADGDVKGHKVEKAGPEDTTSAENVSVDKKECEPLAYAQLGVPVGDPAASVMRKVVQEPQKPEKTDSQNDGELTDEDFEEAVKSAFNVTATAVFLSSYEAGGAEKAAADLRAAADTCSGGFTGGAKGEELEVTGIKKEKITGGEEAHAWTITTEQEGEPFPLKLAVVRQGSTLAVFSSYNLASAGSGKDFDLPTEVIDAQVAKLG